MYYDVKGLINKPQSRRKVIYSLKKYVSLMKDIEEMDKEQIEICKAIEDAIYYLQTDEKE